MQPKFRRERFVAALAGLIVALGILAALGFILQPALSPVRILCYGLYVTVGFALGVHRAEQDQRHLLKQWQSFMPKVHDDYMPEIIKFTLIGPVVYCFIGVFMALELAVGLYDLWVEQREAHRAANL
jgi:hypothetical protein